MSEDAQRTIHAQEAFKFGDIFGFKFSRVVFGEKRKLRLAEGEMSTDGGRKARQPITLSEDDGTKALVCGWIDVPKRSAELRSFNNVRQQFEARHGSEIDIGREDYEHVLNELQGFFKAQKIETRLVDVNAPVSLPKTLPPATAPEAMPVGMAITLIGMGVAIGLIFGYLMFGG